VALCDTQKIVDRSAGSKPIGGDTDDYAFEKASFAGR
jgi:hypothetical protein